MGTRRWTALAIGVLLLSAGLSLRLTSETLTLSTSYPAPSGVYQSLITTGGLPASPVNTILARDAGSVGIGSTAAPASTLDVRGTAQLRGSAAGAGLYVNGAGNVGVGTTAPGGALDVENGASNARLCLNGPCVTTLKTACVRRDSTKSTKGACGFSSSISCNAGEIAVGGGMYGGGNDALQDSAAILTAGVPTGWTISAFDLNGPCANNTIPNGTVATGSPPSQGTMFGAATVVCCAFP